ncbi:hypothetical protein LXA43DRAFT_1036240 [Ganoderma leucocontextum]|nr:hypothetical protein LXA43DRAFT_1036240 [Ganoderma leucocontextum]
MPGMHYVCDLRWGSGEQACGPHRGHAEYGAGFWREEWTVKGSPRRVWRDVDVKGKRVAVDVSETGDGNVSPCFPPSSMQLG